MGKTYVFKWTIDLWKRACNGNLVEIIDGEELRIAGEYIDGETLHDNYDEIAKYWMELCKSKNCSDDSMHKLAKFEVDTRHGLIAKKYRFDKSEIDTSKDYHICIVSWKRDDDYIPYHPMICDNNSKYEVWINQGLYDKHKIEETAKARLYGDFYKWEEENVPTEIIKYTRMAYDTYELGEDSCAALDYFNNLSYEEFVCSRGYIDGSFPPDIEDDLEWMMHHVIMEAYGLTPDVMR